MPLKQPFSQIVTKNAILFVFLAIFIRVFITIQDYLINQMLWITIACGGYFICTSGVVYTMLNNVPMFGLGQDQYGKVVVENYFMRSSRGQYGAEGYITSGLALIISASFLMMIKANSWFESVMHRRIAIIISIFVCFIGMVIYVSVYKIKTPWYQTNFWPPESYLKGPLMRDQGNNI